MIIKPKLGYFILYIYLYGITNLQQSKWDIIAQPFWGKTIETCIHFIVNDSNSLNLILFKKITVNKKVQLEIYDEKLTYINIIVVMKYYLLHLLNMLNMFRVSCDS